MDLTKRDHASGEEGHVPGLPTADGNLPAENPLLPHEFPFGLFGKSDDLLCPLPQEHPVVGEDDAVAAAVKQLDAQLVLQLHELAGERGLRHVEQGCGPGDVFLAGHCQKVSQDAQLHRKAPRFLKVL